MSDERFYSQQKTLQDRWVAEQLPDVSQGFFLDIGCGHWQTINNTLHFELLGWRGIGIDLNGQFASGWAENRPRSRFFAADATKLDYSHLLACMPLVMDYLSIDLEPPEQSLDALRAVLASGHRFHCVTFEHDEYRGTGTRDIARQLMAEHGYQWIECRNDQDDFYRLG